MGYGCEAEPQRVGKVDKGGNRARWAMFGQKIHFVCLLNKSNLLLLFSNEIIMDHLVDEYRIFILISSQSILGKFSIMLNSIYFVSYFV